VLVAITRSLGLAGFPAWRILRFAWFGSDRQVFSKADMLAFITGVQQGEFDIA
jgi:hypothetical protein